MRGDQPTVEQLHAICPIAVRASRAILFATRPALRTNAAKVSQGNDGAGAELNARTALRVARVGVSSVVVLKARRTSRVRDSTNRTSRAIRMADEKPTLLEHEWVEFSARVRRVCKRSAALTLSAAIISFGLLIASITCVFALRYIVVPRCPASLSQDLVFDYTAAAPVARVSFIPQKFANTGESKPRKGRIVSAKQNFDVDIEFVVPDSEYNVNVGMFQVNAKLLTPSGKTLLERSRPGIVKYTSKEVKWLKTIVWWPFHALGLIEEQQNVRVAMVQNYKEDSESPFTDIEVTMKPHAGSARLPQIYEARAIVHLSMNFVAKLLYFYPIASSFVLVGLFWSGFSFAAFVSTVISLLIMGSKIDEKDAESPMKPDEIGKYARAIADAMDSAESSQAPAHTTNGMMDEGLRRRNVSPSS